jgi:hypothetical protein
MPLRVGVMLDDATVPGWVVRVLDAVDACSIAELVGCVVQPESRTPRGAIARAWGRRSSLLYRLYERIDARRFRPSRDPLDRHDLSPRLAQLPVLRLAPIPPPPDEEPLDGQTLAELQRWDLDVLLKLGSGAVRGAVMTCARHGVWAYHHGDPVAYPGGPPLFWEIYDGTPVSQSVLKALTHEPEAAAVIYRSFSAADPISLHRSRTRVYWKSAEFVGRKLRDLHRDRELAIPEDGEPSTPKAPARCIPTNLQMLRFGGRVMIRLARQKAREALWQERWFIAYRPRTAGLPSADAFRDAAVLFPTRDRFFADPCLVQRDGASYVFFERLPLGDEKGVIVCSELTANDRGRTPRVVLERPYHLSYPFVFLVGDDAYMLPETAANRTIELYKAESFPDRWKLEAILVAGVKAVDPTLIAHDGRYWLFANVAGEEESTNDELFLFSAESLLGPWRSHPRNPVVSDARRARPAGRPFVNRGGSLIRPSQDCSDSYGRAVVFNRIDVLSEADYRETTIGRLEPHWRRGLLGTHTYSRSGAWEAVDGRVWVDRFAGRRMLRRSARAGADGNRRTTDA